MSAAGSWEDLCTVTELKAMSQRIEVAMYLREGMIYQDILKRTRRQQRHHQSGQPVPAVRRRRVSNRLAPSGCPLGGDEDTLNHGNETYRALAGCYDEMTEDVHYAAWADFLEKLFSRETRPIKTVLDLACGTGTMSFLLAARGYEMIGVDFSPEMLAIASNKTLAWGGDPSHFPLPSHGKARPLRYGRRLRLPAGQHQSRHQSREIVQSLAAGPFVFGARGLICV